jgi:tetratricopeptide (TPR) repeat protein
MAMSAYQLRNYGDLVKLYDKIRSNVFIPPSSLKRSIYWAIDFAFYRYGEIDKSLEIQRQFTIPISQYIGDHYGLNSIYASHGGYLYILGLYSQARDIFLTALDQGSHSNQVLTRLYNNLSLVYFKTGESSKYVDTQFLALEIAREENNYDHQIKIYRNLHVFYRKNRNWDLASQYIDLAAELAIETENISDLITIYISKAVFEDQYLKNRENAFLNLDLAESIINENTEPRFIARVFAERAMLLRKNQNLNQSLEYLIASVCGPPLLYHFPRLHESGQKWTYSS